MAKPVKNPLPQAFRDTPLDELRVHPKNARKGSVSAISESIEHNGFFGACVAQVSTGHILVGNHRFLAARENGMATIPVMWVDVSNAHATRILLADNRTNDVASYDKDALAALLSDLSNTDRLDGTGYTEDDLEALISEITTPNFEPATEEEQGRLDKLKPCVCPECGHEFKA